MDKYKETIEKLKNLLNESKSKGHIIVRIEDVENTIPELQESKDEKIRKELIRAFKSLNTIKVWNGIERTDILAWLEKQGHQEKPQVYKTEDGEVITYSEDEGYKVVEPKFKVGDWIVSGYNSVAYIESISETKYNLQCKDGSHEKLSVDYINRCWHLWTIQDAKDGDVLSDGTTIFIFKDLLSDGSVMSYCDYDTYSGESEAFCPLSMNLMCSKITPAAKEQRDILFEGMADAGYTFDFEKKELKKIEQESTELSGKDEEIIDSIISICDREQNNYKTLSSDYYRIEKLKNWLKYLQPQSHWKPSEEQMAALSSAMGDSTSTHYSATLHSLYNDLKKL